MDTETYNQLFCQVIKEFNSETKIGGIRWKNTWESIEYPKGYEKPPKELFEAKLQELIDAQPWKELREERNKRIAETDYLAIPDYPHPTPEAEQAWLDYRQALRDLPANTTDPENPVWPEAPTP
jgi:hypothetical protein